MLATFGTPAEVFVLETLDASIRVDVDEMLDLFLELSAKLIGGLVCAELTGYDS